MKLSVPGVECFVASRPKRGQQVCGDTFVCKDYQGGALVGAIDGLGHGEQAATASSLAKEIMERHPGEPLPDLVRRCDGEMRRTRGAVASVARFECPADTMSWLGIGNVEGVLLRRLNDGCVEREGMPIRGGVIGYTLPPITVSTFEVSPGDMLVLATDGLTVDFIEDLRFEGRLPDIARGLLEDYGRPDDDALVLAARYTGGCTR